MIREIFRLEGQELRRMVTSLQFWLAVCGVTFLYYITSHMGTVSYQAVLIRVLEIPMGGVGGMAVWAVVVYPTMSRMLQELEHRYYMPILTRTSRTSYLASRILFVYVGTMLTEYTALVLYVLVSLLSLPMGSAEVVTFLGYHPAYLGLMAYPWLYLLVVFVQFSCLTGTLSLIALLTLLYRPNLMMACITPILFLYLEDYVLQRILGWPRYKSIALYEAAYMSIAENIETSCILGYIQMLIVSVIAVLLIKKVFRWRVEHG